MVTITPIAEQKIKELIKEEENAVGLRIYVKGGGCSGYQYGMSFEDKTSDDDTIIEKGDVKVPKAPQCLAARRWITWIACKGQGLP